MYLYLSNLNIKRVIRKIKPTIGDDGVEMCLDNGKWVSNTILFADDTILFGSDCLQPFIFNMLRQQSALPGQAVQEMLIP